MSEWPIGPDWPPPPDWPPAPPGSEWPAGAKGDKGDPGATGSTGQTGQTGAQGPQGVKGDTGDTGPRGPIGPQGPAGASGEGGAGGAAEMTGGGWQIKWTDGRTEMVAAFMYSEAETAYEPFVLGDDQKSLIPASVKGSEFTLQHPSQFTRAGNS